MASDFASLHLEQVLFCKCDGKGEDGGSKKERWLLFLSAFIVADSRCWPPWWFTVSLETRKSYCFLLVLSKCFEASPMALFICLFYFSPLYYSCILLLTWMKHTISSLCMAATTTTEKVISAVLGELLGVIGEIFLRERNLHDTGHFRVVCSAAAVCVGTWNVHILSFNDVSTQCEILASSSEGALRLQ